MRKEKERKEHVAKDTGLNKRQNRLINHTLNCVDTNHIHHSYEEQLSNLALPISRVVFCIYTRKRLKEIHPLYCCYRRCMQLIENQNYAMLTSK